jgi:hypothetical protein
MEDLTMVSIDGRIRRMLAMTAPGRAHAAAQASGPLPGSGSLAGQSARPSCQADSCLLRRRRYRGKEHPLTETHRTHAHRPPERVDHVASTVI